MNWIDVYSFFVVFVCGAVLGAFLYERIRGCPSPCAHDMPDPGSFSQAMAETMVKDVEKVMEEEKTPPGHEWVVDHYEYEIKTDLASGYFSHYMSPFLTYTCGEDRLDKKLREIKKKKGKVIGMKRVAVKVLKHTEKTR